MYQKKDVREVSSSKDVAVATKLVSYSKLVSLTIRSPYSVLPERFINGPTFWVAVSHVLNRVVW